MEPSSHHRRHPLVVLLLVAVSIGAIGYFALRGAAAEPPIAGLVRTTEIKIAPEISGRMGAFRVKAGDRVHQGDALAELDNPELAAAVAEAKAAVGLATATRDRVYAGPRQELVDILAREVDKAQSNLVYARQQVERVVALAARENASRQDLDKATAEVAHTQADLLMAQARHGAAQVGPTAEERRSADAKVAQAEATLAVLERRLDKALLTAPVDGVVQVIVAEPGEAIVPGQPVMTLDAGHDRWFTFNVREDRLDGIDIGTKLDLVGDTGQVIPARVTEVRGLGEFATWRAARAVGDHDLNTFLVRADPVSPSETLEAGMTVWLNGPNQGAR